jgi:hypothetical protein
VEFAKQTNLTPQWMRSGQRGIVIMHMVQTVLSSEGAFCSYCHYLLTIMIETEHIKVRNKHLWLLLTKLGL